MFLRVLAAFLVFLSSCAYAQRAVNEDSDWKERIYVGGGGGLNGGSDGYGNRYFYVALSPIVGYMITQQFSSGVGVQWQLIRYPDVDVSISQYGLSPFVRYNFGKLFAYSEYDIINSSRLSDDSRVTYYRLLAGLGYSLPLGRRGAINGMALYDLIYRNTGPFTSPWVIRVFVSF